jgi:hypothetical protein
MRRAAAEQPFDQKATNERFFPVGKHNAYLVELNLEDFTFPSSGKVVPKLTLKYEIADGVNEGRTFTTTTFLDFGPEEGQSSGVAKAKEIASRVTSANFNTIIGSEVENFVDAAIIVDQMIAEAGGRLLLEINGSVNEKKKPDGSFARYESLYINKNLNA